MGFTSHQQQVVKIPFKIFSQDSRNPVWEPFTGAWTRLQKFMQTISIAGSPHHTQTHTQQAIQWPITPMICLADVFSPCKLPCPYKNVLIQTWKMPICLHILLTVCDLFCSFLFSQQMPLDSPYWNFIWIKNKLQRYQSVSSQTCLKAHLSSPAKQSTYAHVGPGTICSINTPFSLYFPFPRRGFVMCFILH